MRTIEKLGTSETLGTEMRRLAHQPVDGRPVGTKPVARPHSSERLKEAITMTSPRCRLTEAKAEVGIVAPAEAAAQVSAGQSVLLDVREPEEWQHGHIYGSVPAPRGLLEFLADPPVPATAGAGPGRSRHRGVCVRHPRDLAAATSKHPGLPGPCRPRGRLKAWMEAGPPNKEHEYTGI